jgi:hypothetical protein
MSRACSASGIKMGAGSRATPWRARANSSAREGAVGGISLLCLTDAPVTRKFFRILDLDWEDFFNAKAQRREGKDAKWRLA